MELVGHCAVCGADVDLTWRELPEGPIHCAAHRPPPIAPEVQTDVTMTIDDDTQGVTVDVEGEFE